MVLFLCLLVHRLTGLQERMFVQVGSIKSRILLYVYCNFSDSRNELCIANAAQNLLYSHGCPKLGLFVIYVSYW